MQRVEQVRKYVSLTEALSWIAFRTFLDAAGTKERLRRDTACQAALEDAAREFSHAAGDGLLKARGRYVVDANASAQGKAGYCVDIQENHFIDFQQFDLDREKLQHLPAGGRTVIGTWDFATVGGVPNGSTRLVRGWVGSAEESYARTFQSYAEETLSERASLADGYVGVEVLKEDLLREFPKPQDVTVRPSAEETVAWCRQQMAGGVTNMNDAWEIFKRLPQFKGLSRDNALRTAWTIARTKIN